MNSKQLADVESACCHVDLQQGFTRIYLLGGLAGRGGVTDIVCGAGCPVVLILIVWRIGGRGGNEGYTLFGGYLHVKDSRFRVMFQEF